MTALLSSALTPQAVSSSGSSSLRAQRGILSAAACPAQHVGLAAASGTPAQRQRQRGVTCSSWDRNEPPPKDLAEDPEAKFRQ